MCDVHLNGGALVCDRTDPHQTGHTYAASWAADGTHDDITGDDQ